MPATPAAASVAWRPRDSLTCRTRPREVTRSWRSGNSRLLHFRTPLSKSPPLAMPTLTKPDRLGTGASKRTRGRDEAGGKTDDFGSRVRLAISTLLGGQAQGKPFRFLRPEGHPV